MPGGNAGRSGRVQLGAGSLHRGAGVRMPGFFGYRGWAVAFLVPTFILAAFVFFR
ncbi:sodium:proton antiporter [Belnapia moabensis]|uniref:sodium:proton antiporter n=1 Tax=Belnapia moabensis TaxID=365533 RepID=UPI0012EE5F3C|nr:sodium:proton antiporter [Belnapia moabensis]